MDTGRGVGDDGARPSRPPHASGNESSAELTLRLAGLRARVDTLGKELEEFGKKVDDLERALSGPSASPDKSGAAAGPKPATAAAEEKEDEKDLYLENLQGRLHDLIHEELSSVENAVDPPPADEDPGMVCPSCGAVVDRTEEACPQCDAATEPAPERGGRAFPLSAEKFLYIFNDRFGWFSKTSEKAMYYADRKGDYVKAIDLLQVIVRFMEENLALLKNKHRDFRLALAYAYLGRCYFQSRRIEDAITHYRKGILLKAGNSYNCEIGLTAVYRDLVRTIRETGTPLSPKSHPFLSPREIATLNSLGMRTTA